MVTKTEIFNKNQMKEGLPDIRPGDTVRIFQKIQEKEKGGKRRKVQSFEGIVIARKHGKGISSTITVRKIISGIGVEKIFPIHSPMLQKIEILKKVKTRRAKLYYLRTAKGKKARLKNRTDFSEPIVWKKPTENLSKKQAEGSKENQAEPKPETKKAKGAGEFSEKEALEKKQTKKEPADKPSK